MLSGATSVYMDTSTLIQQQVVAAQSAACHKGVLQMRLGHGQLALQRVMQLQALKSLRVVRLMQQISDREKQEAVTAAGGQGQEVAHILVGAVIGLVDGHGPLGSVGGGGAGVGGWRTSNGAATAALQSGGAQWTKLVFQLQQEIVGQVEVLGREALTEYAAVFGGSASSSTSTGSSAAAARISRGQGLPSADDSNDAVAAFKQMLAQLPQVLKTVEKDGAAAEVAEVLLGLFQGEFNRGYGDVASFMRGHLYYCPEGHPYVIGECGGAMESSRCPECGATIGGGGHQLAQGNRGADAELLTQLQETWRDGFAAR